MMEALPEGRDPTIVAFVLANPKLPNPRLYIFLSPIAHLFTYVFPFAIELFQYSIGPTPPPSHKLRCPLPSSHQFTHLSPFPDSSGATENREIDEGYEEKRVMKAAKKKVEAIERQAAEEEVWQILEGHAFTHCRTCKAPYHIRVHGSAECREI